MNWKLADGSTLSAAGPTTTAVVYTMQSDIPPGPYRALEEFVLARGASELRRFRVSTWSLEDDLGVVAYAVIDRQLRRLTVVRNYALSGPRALRVEEAVELDGLTPTAE